MPTMSVKSLLFFSCLIAGVFLAVSSESWFGVWCGLELNLMSFIPFISSKNNRYLSEASLKYFLIQALGSTIIILGSMLFLLNYNFLILMSTALLLKLGVAPFHFWFPQVMEGLTWPQSLILMTLQKISPLYLLMYTLSNWGPLLMMMSAALSAMAGAIGGMNQTLLRKLLAFSSINHMSWMMFSMLISETLWFIYFMFYALISGSVVMLFYTQNCFYLSQLMFFNKPMTSLMSFLSLLSLGGLPPFSGFIPKWIIIQEMIKHSLMLPFIILLGSSLLTLYYYLRVSIMFITVSAPSMKWNVKSSHTNSTPLTTLLNFLGVLTPSLFFLT
uniref:NADH-ubiquinone oxidoreductase chain 2 n=1 Tax=Calocaris macandreae TaxID=1267412 RepID=L0E929_CALMF|nr:NADH dehydrogenase subunit 2 [Calocaris macandreae]